MSADFEAFLTKALLTDDGKIIIGQNSKTNSYATYLTQPFAYPRSAEDPSKENKNPFAFLSPISSYPTYDRPLVAYIPRQLFVGFVNSTMPIFYVAMRRNHAAEFGEKFYKPTGFQAATYLRSLKSNTEDKTGIIFMHLNFFNDSNLKLS